MTGQCASKAKSTGGQCGRKALRGQRVCQYHGGKSPQALRAADRRMAEERAEKAVTRLLHNSGASPVTDPFDALLRLAGRLEVAAEHVGSRVNDLGSVRTTDAKHAEQVRGEVQVWMALNEQLRKALAEIVRLDIAGRQVALSEKQAAVVERVIVAVLAGVGVALDERVRGIVYRELTAVAPKAIEAVS